MPCVPLPRPQPGLAGAAVLAAVPGTAALGVLVLCGAVLFPAAPVAAQIVPGSPGSPGKPAVAATPAVPATPGAPDGPVNPLTGVPLSLEQMHWAVEQAHLDEQLQASLLNRRRFELERQRLEQGGAAALSAAAEGVPYAAAPAVPATAITASPVEARRRAPDPGPDARRTHSAPRPERRDSGRTPTPAPAAWQVVGLRAQGNQWCVLVAEAERLWPVCRGEWRRGHYVDAVSEQSYTVDGVVHPFEMAAGQWQASATAPAPLLAPTTEEGETEAGAAGRSADLVPGLRLAAPAAALQR